MEFNILLEEEGRGHEHTKFPSSSSFHLSLISRRSECIANVRIAWCMGELGGAGDRFGDYLCVDGRNLSCVNGQNPFTNSKFTGPITKMSRSSSDGRGIYIPMRPCMWSDTKEDKHSWRFVKMKACIDDNGWAIKIPQLPSSTEGCARSEFEIMRRSTAENPWCAKSAFVRVMAWVPTWTSASFLGRVRLLFCATTLCRDAQNGMS